MKNIFDMRINMLRKKMDEQGMDYYLIPTSDYHNSEYVCDYFKVREFFSGFTGSNGTLLIGKENALLWTDGRYFVQAKNQLEGSKIILMKMGEPGVETIPEYLLHHMESNQCLGFDGKVVSASYVSVLKETLSGKNIRYAYKKDLSEEIFQEREPLPCKPIWQLDANLTELSVQEKLQWLHSQMEDYHAKVLVLTKLDELMWLLNVRGDDILHNLTALCFGIVTEKESFLYINGASVSTEMQKQFEKDKIFLREYTKFWSELENYCSENDVWLNKDCNYFIFNAAKKNAKSIIETDTPIAKKKACKDQVELTNIRKIYIRDSAITTNFLMKIKNKVQNGENLSEVDAIQMLDRMRSEDKDFISLSFDTICGYKGNGAMMHYCAKKENCSLLAEEGFLLIDSGGQYLGGTTDVTRTIALGELSDEMKRDFTLVVVGMLRLLNVTFLYGATGRVLDAIARQPLWEYGMDYKCGTGHGIGYMLSVHEGPQRIGFTYVNNGKETILEKGMLVSNEPGVYKEGKYGIRIENIMECVEAEKTADGQFMRFEPLTYVPIDLEAIDVSYMEQRDIENLNKYHKSVYNHLKEKFLDEEDLKWLQHVTRHINKSR